MQMQRQFTLTRCTFIILIVLGTENETRKYTMRRYTCWKKRVLLNPTFFWLGEEMSMSRSSHVTFFSSSFFFCLKTVSKIHYRAQRPAWLNTVFKSNNRKRRKASQFVWRVGEWKEGCRQGWVSLGDPGSRK